MRMILTLFLFLWPQTPSKDTAPTYTSNIEILTIFPKQPSIAVGGSYIIKVVDKDDKLMVSVANDGKVIYGENYKPDDGAKTFWEVLVKYYPIVCEKIQEKKQ